MNFENYDQSKYYHQREERKFSRERCLIMYLLLLYVGMSNATEPRVPPANINKSFSSNKYSVVFAVTGTMSRARIYKWLISQWLQKIIQMEWDGTVSHACNCYRSSNTEEMWWLGATGIACIKHKCLEKKLRWRKEKVNVVSSNFSAFILF